MIEVRSPACLPLGLIVAEGQPALLGITLQYPPIEMVVKPHNELSVTGGRANIAREQALKWFETHDLPPKAEIEIELAIPAHMGLGSEAMLGLSVAKGLRDLADLENSQGLEEIGLGSEWALEALAHSQGGVLVAGKDGRLIRRHAIEHDDSTAWVFVIYLPHAPQGTLLSFETDRRSALLNAKASADLEPLWSALAADDINTFGPELMKIQAATRAAIDIAITADVREVLEVIQSSREVVAWGQSFGGLAAWGLVHGAGASQEARQRMRRAMSYEGGTVTAATINNVGATSKRLE